MSAQNFVPPSEFVKRFFIAFGAIVLMASAGGESFLADCLALGQLVAERVPAGKFDISVASRMHQVICWIRVSSLELVGLPGGGGGPLKRNGSPSSATSISAASRLPAIHRPLRFRILLLSESRRVVGVSFRLQWEERCRPHVFSGGW